MSFKKSIFLLLLITNFSSAQNTFPKFREVINRLFSEYELIELEEENEIILEKRKTGWFVTTINSKDTIQQLYWNKNETKFEDLNFEKKSAAISMSDFSEIEKEEDSEEEIKLRMLNAYPELSYDIFPYFGYDGCFYDNIILLEEKTELNENDIYILGYSYSQLATNLLNDNYDFELKNLNYNLPFVKNSMNKNQLEKFLLYSEKSINHYRNLNQKNTNFKTITGTIYMKYCNEIVSLYLNLSIFQNNEIATNYLLQHDLYSENINLFSKLILDSCEQNAILFTAGDNDTYPILYYQLKNNYRKDILVLNTSLLNDPRYAIMMKNGNYNDNNTIYSLDDEFIKSKFSQYVILTSENNESLEISELNKIISEIKTSETSKKYLILNSNKFTFKYNKKKISWVIEDEVIYRNQLIILDIIAKNNWKRPIYFTDYNSESDYLGLNNYLQFEGLIYKVTSENNNKNEDLGYIKNPDLIEQFLDKIEFKNTQKLPVEEKEIIDYFRNIYLRLAKYYFEKELKTKATITLNNCFIKYNNNTSPLNFYTLEFVDLYKSLNENEKSDSIKNEILKNIENKNHLYFYKTEEYINEKLLRYKKYIETTYN